MLQCIWSEVAYGFSTVCGWHVGSLLSVGGMWVLYCLWVACGFSTVCGWHVGSLLSVGGMCYSVFGLKWHVGSLLSVGGMWVLYCLWVACVTVYLV